MTRSEAQLIYAAVADVRSAAMDEVMDHLDALENVVEDLTSGERSNEAQTLNRIIDVLIEAGHLNRSAIPTP